MNTKSVRIVRGTVVAVIALAASFTALRPLGILCALMIRRHWPEAWFSGLITWYADFFVAGLSIGIGILVGRQTIRHSGN
jgi:hypothetical protein